MQKEGANEGDVVLRADGKEAVLRREGDDLIAFFEDESRVVTHKIQRKRQNLKDGIANLRRQFK